MYAFNIFGRHLDFGPHFLCRIGSEIKMVAKWAWGQQQGMCMDFDGTQVTLVSVVLHQGVGAPPAIIAELWLHLFTCFTKNVRHSILLYFSFAGNDKFKVARLLE